MNGLIEKIRVKNEKGSPVQFDVRQWLEQENERHRRLELKENEFYVIYSLNETEMEMLEEITKYVSFPGDNKKQEIFHFFMILCESTRQILADTLMELENENFIKKNKWNESLEIKEMKG